MLIGREKECQLLENKINSSLKTKAPLSIYISGTPGTGKTASVNLIVQNFNTKAHVIYINCASISSKADLCRAILSQFEIEIPSANKLSSEVDNFFLGSKKTSIVVLDEIDHLNSRNHATLYSAFEWPYKTNGKAILIGIANSLDLIDRILPKLKFIGEPLVLAYEPYSKQQLVRILQHKLAESSMDAKAIELCAAKVATSTGDVRVAMKVAQQALKQTFEGEKSNVLKSVNRDPSYETPKKNACKEVIAVMKKVYSSPLTRAKIPLQPAVLLGTFIRIIKDRRIKSISHNELFIAYSKVCKAINIPLLEHNELLEALQVLETQSMIGIQGHRLTFEVDIPQARAAIGNTELISSIDNISL